MRVDLIGITRSNPILNNEPQIFIRQHKKSIIISLANQSTTAFSLIKHTKS